MKLNAMKVDELRLNLGLTVTQLAERSEITITTVYNALRGKGITTKTIIALARTLGVKPAEIAILGV